MISTDFAPNERLSDAIVSLKLLFAPWKWKQGKELYRLKKSVLSQLFHVKDKSMSVCFFLSGRSALYHLLQSLHLPANSEVLVQGFTCEAVILPILAHGLKPVYVDIESQSFSMNPIELEKKITQKSKVVIVQHSFGIPPLYLNTIRSISKRHNLVLIEDIAHGYNQEIPSFQNRYRQGKIPNSYFILSFGRSKALSSVFGGGVATNNRTVANELEERSSSMGMPSGFFIFKTLLYKPLSVIIKTTYPILLGKIIHFICLRLNILIPEISPREKRGEYDLLLDKSFPNGLACLLLHQQKKYESLQSQRKRIVNLYDKSLKKIIKSFDIIALSRYPYLVEDRKSLIRVAAKKHIYLGNWYDQVVGPKGFSLRKAKYSQGSCPVAESVCQSIINLPTSITEQQAKTVIRLISLTHERR